MARRESRTPIFSFDTPSRDRGSTRNVRNSTARDILRTIVESGTPTATTRVRTAATETTSTTVTSELTSTPVSTPSTTQVQSRTVVAPSSQSTSTNQGSSGW